MRGARLILGMGLWCLSGLAAADEPTTADCWRAADAAEAVAARRPAGEQRRLDAESLIRQGRGEGGSGDIDECFEFVEQALALLNDAESETPPRL
jgi:hypothetical protein